MTPHDQPAEQTYEGWADSGLRIGAAVGGVAGFAVSIVAGGTYLDYSGFEGYAVGGFIILGVCTFGGTGAVIGGGLEALVQRCRK